MKWIECNGMNITSGVESKTVTIKTVNYTLTLKLSDMPKGLKHIKELTCTCRTYFAPVDNNESYATNSPDYTYDCTSVINIYDQYGKYSYCTLNIISPVLLHVML